MGQPFFSDLVGPFPDIVWQPDFISAQAQAQLLRFCLEDVAWERKQMRFGSRTVEVPRELAWFGEVPYAYSGLRHAAVPMPAPLAALRESIETHLASLGIEQHFNSVLLNHYRSGADSIGLHADDESQLGARPVIASVSLGDPRTFIFAHKTSRLRHKSRLTGGSLLVMKGDCQDQWRHGIDKEPGACQRVNLTFRKTCA